MQEPCAPEPCADCSRKDRWHPGERCLAPSPVDEKLCEACVKSVTVDEHGRSFAIILYSDLQERKIPLQRLQEVKPVQDGPRNVIFDDEDLEKPYFPGRKFPMPAVDFRLSEEGHAVPYTINRYLRDYQREGARFLYGHYRQGRGCILGDDMGLGKTVQVIAFLAAVLRKKGTREDIENNMPEFLLRSMKKEPLPSVTKKMFLIVAPLSVLYNWKDELDTWGYFRVTVLHGNKKDNELMRIKQRKCEVALTTYETLRLCLDELNSLEWAAVVVDEAHRIKNPTARVTEVMKALKCSVRIGLTGTILQNNMKELWCVMDWAVPGLLGSRVYFKRQFSDPVEHGQRHTATKRELATGRKAMRRLAGKMAGCFLRRTKALIRGQLPKKEDRMVYCSLTEFQKAVYQTVLETEDVALILQSSEPCTCQSGRKRRSCCYKTNSRGESVKTLCLSYLTVLQKVANHVALLQAASTSKQETLIQRICDQVFSKFPDFVRKSKDAAFETLSDPKYSGKMKVLQQLLNHCRKNRDKVLLFSFSTKLLDVLQQYCMASGLDYRRLDGSTKSEERLKIVKEFNSSQDVNVCLVSTMAGGLGLNFVGANVVILFDPTWNPANDLQAIDRAYRIGQCRDVKVLRLISLGTVEEIMYLRQLYKQQLHCVVVGSENAKRYFEAVQGSKEHRGELFGIGNLFKLRSQGSCLTRDILEREGQVEAGILTATTWLGEGPPAGRPEAPREPINPEPRGSEQAVEPTAKAAWDLCSDFSEDESGGNSRTKTAGSKASDPSRASGPAGQLTLLQCGFSKLLETERNATEDSDGSVASDDPSADEQGSPPHPSAEARDAACQKQQNSLAASQQPKFSSIPTPAEKCVFGKSDETSEQSASSESDGEKNFKSTAERRCTSPEVTGSEDSDIIFPTQDATLSKPALEGSEDSRAETPANARSDGDRKRTNDRGSVQVPSNSKPGYTTLKSVMERRGPSDISDESDDVDISAISEVGKQRATRPVRSERKKGIRRQLCSLTKARKPTSRLCAMGEGSNSQTIDGFSSSDDDSPASPFSCSRQSHKATATKERTHPSSKLPRHTKENSTFVPSKSMKFSNKAVDSQEQMCESMDILLGGVQEVAYIHSNQKVIGSSKAENHMSRWATRDVFELKQFSQLPANIAVCSSKTYKDKANEEEGQPPREEGVSSALFLSHPVSQRKKRVYRTGQSTFIVGETPNGIRRKQFEEMASYFKSSCVKEFARLIADATSEERQRMLRDFYTSQYPELEELFPVESAPEVVTSTSEKGHSGGNRSHKREPLTQVKPSSSQALAFRESTNKIAHKGKSLLFHNDNAIQEEVLSDEARTLGCPQEADDGRSSHASEGTTASSAPDRNSEGCGTQSADTMQGQRDLPGTGLPGSRLSRLENKAVENQAVDSTSVAGLLGDTSILDDLFKSHRSGPIRMPKRTPAGPVEKAKQRPKDFWDILNEQNTDSLSKLTDLATIETLCEKASRPAPSRAKGELEASLWKSNDKFLWKTFCPSDPEESTASTTQSSPGACT
ncbi:DNA excision repair protein ERCC-6-like 2 isoform X3 [Ochotona curzoniae]|uniref:DNA excision repair protein ERCC-6-like 2 isoform X3 n=1 Tax=Ochotona curzoniae TaxID=130825 RepID=UPI001B34C9B4|nr:DNA excision repair protein ERCC-6-like 2 isoform X3 [Ochotona curzoniae]